MYNPAIGAGLWRVSSAGGEVEQLTKPDFGELGYAHTWPQHLPDGRHLLFTVWGAANGLSVLDLDTGEWISGSPGNEAGQYLRNGRILFAASETGRGLFGALFDTNAATRASDPVPVLDDIRL